MVSAAAELLDLLGELQADGPVAVVVDDEQRVDQFSMRALAFVRRRLSADRVLLLVSREEEQSVPPPASDEATVIRLTGFTASEVADFVASHVGGSVGAGAELRWVRRTAATFLAALHLWRGRGPETVWAAEQALADPSIDPKTADIARMQRSMGRSREAGWPAAMHALRHLPAEPTNTSARIWSAWRCGGAARHGRPAARGAGRPGRRRVPGPIPTP